MASKDRYQRFRVPSACKLCGRVRMVCKHSPEANCRSCSNRLRSPRICLKRRTGTFVTCPVCGQAFYSRKCESRRFCSKPCADAGKRKHKIETRSCATCGKEFKCSEKPRGNASGRYCSHECRDKGYAGVIHGDPSRKALGPPSYSRWNSKRRKFFRAGNDFCMLCGETAGRLPVHHVEGCRNVTPDDVGPLATLCPKHHSLLEPLTQQIASLSPDMRRLCAFLIKESLFNHMVPRNGN